ncbi:MULTISPECIES: hypothetical protein [Micromonospora]|uniref:Uncharacterized protein n=1 Tax=Micromonospora yangpuensis TaxID=683228 RepID=A0A1C6TWR1_9ACTN|nr:hypothetical protein [Micromonospora yangpuensis]GGM01498.1 hypothetical protein GCM10012279_18860 [Micromonospora yangpuensis]SCL46215.1 hypothetical protein GA0070617_0189 [Micromonospora yangpuensis]
MFTLVAMAILYVFGFVFLYGVIRVAVRHAMEDLDARRAEAHRMDRAVTAHERNFIRENEFLANG